MNKEKIKKILVIIFLSFLIPLISRAITIDFGKSFPKETFEKMVDTILNVIFWIGIVLFPLMILIAAFYFLTSGGSPEKTKTGKKIIFGAFIGLMIVLFGKGLPSIIKTMLTTSPPGPSPAPTTLTSAVLHTLGDINGDCVVDFVDITAISGAVGARPGDPNWDPAKDLNGNGVIDTCDADIAANSFGLACH
jgi:hypothetical protein